MSKRTILPSKKDLAEATIKVLKNADCIVKTSDINNQVANILEIPEEVLEIEDENGCGTAYGYRMRWVRTELKQKQYILNPQRGEWVINREKLWMVKNDR